MPQILTNMNITLLFTVAIMLLAASSASSAAEDNESSPASPYSDPTVLVWQRSQLRGNSVGSHQDATDGPTSMPTLDRDAVSPGHRCNARRDLCVDEYACINGVCQYDRGRTSGSGNVIGRGGVCRTGIDICDRGYACVNGICQVPAAIAPGGRCNIGDTCANGLACRGGICQRYSSSGGGGMPNGGDCTNNRGGCAGGCSCQPSPINGSDRWNCMCSATEE